MYKMRLKAVCFDMDGVIVDTMPHHVKAWHHAFLREGHEIEERVFFEREGMPGMKTIKDVNILRELNLTQNQMDQIYDEKRAFFKQNAQYDFLEETVKTAQFLKKSGVTIALATGSRREFVTEILSQLSFTFDAVITGDDVNVGKPSPEPYLGIAEKFPFHKKEWLVIENAPLGITSAKRAEMEVWALETTLSADFLKEADKILKKEELHQAVRDKLEEDIR
ncbi:HAD family hydrolase [Fictibacillus iocasae]|uniref:HAD family hydrolase n=1 Tax=Fictibacillus iocasae TaxID=2715437 RepID=A0ABW2NIW0_9BACL